MIGCARSTWHTRKVDASADGLCVGVSNHKHAHDLVEVCGCTFRQCFRAVVVVRLSSEDLLVFGPGPSARRDLFHWVQPTSLGFSTSSLKK